MKTINTAYGKRNVRHVISYGLAVYIKTASTLNEPNGSWWTMNPQRGYVDVPSNGRSLTAAIAENNAKYPENYVYA